MNALILLFSCFRFSLCRLYELGGLTFPYLAVGAIDCIVVCSGIPITTFFNSSPLVHCTFECYVRKNTAIRERLTTDTRYAVGDCDTSKTTAIRERRTTDSRYAVADCYAFKITAIKERQTTDTRYTVGNIHAFKITAIQERRTTDTRYRFAVIFGGNHNIRNILVYPCYGITFAINIQGIYLR